MLLLYPFDAATLWDVVKPPVFDGVKIKLLSVTTSVDGKSIIFQVDTSEPYPKRSIDDTLLGSSGDTGPKE